MIIYEADSKYQKTMHEKCHGCGGTYGQNCRPGFCLWNSFYTERRRYIERLKERGKFDEIALINKYPV